jgi:hypothetical protein
VNSYVIVWAGHCEPAPLLRMNYNEFNLIFMSVLNFKL